MYCIYVRQDTFIDSTSAEGIRTRFAVCESTNVSLYVSSSDSIHMGVWVYIAEIQLHVSEISYLPKFREKRVETVYLQLNPSIPKTDFRCARF